MVTLPMKYSSLLIDLRTFQVLGTKTVLNADACACVISVCAAPAPLDRVDLE
jgi:hypothetical protein